MLLDPGFGFHEVHKALDDTADLVEERAHLVRLVRQIQEQVLPAEVQGQVQDAAPIHIAGHIPVAGGKLVGQGLQTAEGGRGVSGSSSTARLILALGSHLWGGIGAVFDIAAKHFREQESRRQMNRSQQGTSCPGPRPGRTVPSVRKPPAPFSARPRLGGADGRRSPGRNQCRRARATSPGQARFRPAEGGGLSSRSNRMFGE